MTGQLISTYNRKLKKKELKNVSIIEYHVTWYSKSYVIPFFCMDIDFIKSKPEIL